MLTYAEGVAKGVFTPDVFSYANSKDLCLFPGSLRGAAGYQVNLHCENINSQADNFFISFRYTTIEASTIVYSV